MGVSDMIDYNWSHDFSKSYKLESNKYSIEFDLSPHELIAFKSIIDVYLNSNKSWEYSYNNGREHYLRIINDNISDIKFLDQYFNPIENQLSSFIEVHVCFDAKNIKKLDIVSYLKFGYDKNKNDIGIHTLNILSEKINIDISYILSRVKEAIYTDNFFYQNFELIAGDFSGYYDFDDIKLDFGAPTETHSVNRVIRCKIKYKKIICTNLPFKVPLIDTINCDVKIIIALCQLFLRCGISANIYKGVYHNYADRIKITDNIDDTHLGSYNYFQRGIINTNYNDGVPDDTLSLFKKYKLLDYDKQNVFIVSCYSYAYANKIDNNVQSITHYVISLENLAEFEYKKNIQKSRKIKLSKKEKIHNLIEQLFNENIVSKDFVDYFYSIRCLYAHEGVANNRIYQDILGAHDGDKMLQLYMEELTYSVLIQWLLIN